MSRQESLLAMEKGNYWEDINTSSPEAKLSLPTRVMNWTVDVIRPAILSRTSSPRAPLRRTAYLDGLRGFAALLVYWGHHQLWAHETIQADKIFESAFGFEGQYYFACLPFVRTFFSGGHFSVGVFFVISGYVLSAKPLSLIHSGELLKLHDNIASALFRRWLRLFLPVVVVTFLYLTCWHAFSLHTVETGHAGSYSAEVWKWYLEFKNFSFVFRSGGDPWFSYSFHTWSIPVEFRGSICIYTSLVALSRCSRNARLAAEAALAAYFLYVVDGWFCALFVAGMLLADLDLLAAAHDLPAPFRLLAPHKDVLAAVGFVASLYLGGVPSHSREPKTLRASPGWFLLSFLTPQAVFDYKWFFIFWAAIFMVASVPRLPWIKAFFELRFNQYLGRISYAFYLVHGPLIWTLADRLYVATGWARESHAVGMAGWINAWPLSKDGPLGLDLAFLAPHLIILPVTLWLAEVLTRLVDEPSIRFALWLYRKSLAGSLKL